MEAIRRGRPVAVPAHPRRRAGATLFLTAALALLLAAALVGAAPASAGQPQGSPQEALALLALQQAQLTVVDGAASDYLGYAVALSGDTALVGAPYDDVGVNVDQGSAYVFTRSGTSWTLEQKLSAGADGRAGDGFGFSVALSGDTALVGAPYETVDFNNYEGSAYVFKRSGTTWSQQVQLTAGADGAAGDEFGFSVALSGDTALVGAYRDDVSGYLFQGSAYVFTRSGTSWSKQQQLIAFDGDTSDNFGFSVALSGDTALVGAPYDTVDVKTYQGSAYVFTRSGTSWTQQGPALTAADGAAADNFGFSVALSGETALVGAYDDDVGANTDQGSAYVFTRSGTSWSQQVQLTAGAAGAADDNFGGSVALSGDTALVGARYDTVGGIAEQGSAYVFTRSGTSWSQEGAALNATDGAASDQFGHSVALSGETALVGAPYHDVGANDYQGSAYVFLLDGAAPVTAAALAPPANAAGWHSGPVTVTLSASDDLSGVEKTFYRVGDTGAYAEYNAAAKPVISAAGAANLWCYSTDLAGNAETPKAVAVRIDSAAPTSAAAFAPPANAAGWHSGPVTVTLSASADLSGVASTEYRLQGAASWTPYAAPFVITTEGASTWEYRSSDLAGNAEVPKALAVRIDSAAPTSAAAFAPPANAAGWYKGPVTVTLSASADLSGVATTEYRRQGAASWTPYAAPFAVSTQGASTWEYRSLDLAGNLEAAQSFSARIDSRRPTTKAYGAAVRKGKRVKLAYKVVDAKPGCGKAAVTLKMYKGKKLKKTLKAGTRACNVKRSYAWRCTLAKGRYTVKVYARDIAGNAQSKVGNARLTVK